MRLYKYMPQKYLDNFFKRGSLKVGTLYEYRKVEQYGEAIGDGAEGILVTKFSHQAGISVDLGSNSPEALYLRKTFGFVGPPGAIIEFSPAGGINHRVESENAYIFCTTSEYNADVMREFGGACIEIVRPDEFFKAISHTIRHKGTFQHCGPIEYKERETRWDKPHSTHACMVKDSRYAYQKEVRTIWAPAKDAITPLFVNVPAAVRFCRPYALG